MTIPNELAGTIIGRGGERINQIRQEAAARIDIGSAVGNERIITIQASPWAECSRAKRSNCRARSSRFRRLSTCCSRRKCPIDSTLYVL